MSSKLSLVAVTFLSVVVGCKEGGGGGGGTAGVGGSSSSGTGGRGGSTGRGGSGGNGGSQAPGTGGSAAPGTGGSGTGGTGSGTGGTGAPGTGGSAGGSATTDGGGAGTETGTGGAGGSGPSASGYRFGARPQQYPPGSIRPTGDQGALDGVVKAAYDKWKTAYVQALCDGYVVKTASGTTSATAMGHGMILTAMLAGHDPQAQTVFDGLFAVGRKFPSILSVSVPAKHGIGPRPGNGALVAYAIGNNCSKVPEGDSAPEGNLAFAYALLLADKQWGSTGMVNYLDEAKKTINAIKLYEMNPRKLPGLGDWASLPDEGMWTTVATPPNYTVGHFRAFAKASGDMYWMEAVAATQESITRIQTMFSPMTGLFPQFLVGSQNLPGATFLSANNARDHFGGASLVPLWMASDYIGSGDVKAKQALTKITDWLKTKTGGDASKIVDGYRLAGDNIGTQSSMTYVAAFAAIGAFDPANQAWLDGIWQRMSAAPTANQAADTANLLGMLMVTGNWWHP
jgi:endo-1,4-beta-D-glucanase Y